MKKATFLRLKIERWLYFSKARFPTSVLTASGSKGIFSSSLRSYPRGITYSFFRF